MKNKTYTLNTLLAIVLGAALLVCIFVRTFAPRMILPQLDVPNMVLISLMALVADHYLAPDAKRCYICIPVFSALCSLLCGCDGCGETGDLRRHHFHGCDLAVYFCSGPDFFRTCRQGSSCGQRTGPVSGGPVLCWYVPVSVKRMASFGMSFFYYTVDFNALKC